MLPSEMCPRGISLVMSDVNMPCFYRGGEKGVEKAKAIGNLPPSHHCNYCTESITCLSILPKALLHGTLHRSSEFP